MRLVDVFHLYTAEELLGAAVNRGLASLAEEVRALEEADRDCLQFPRAKRCDDARGVLVELQHFLNQIVD